MAGKDSLFLLKSGRAKAHENMAADTALLEFFPQGNTPRLRHYEWEGTCWTFGYAQHFNEVCARLPSHAHPIRRPTGGGIVDHRNDWTYALVVPFAHPLCRMKASDSYVAVHTALAQALRKCGVPARLALCTESVKGPLSACFMAPSPGDVVSLEGRKLAGAAQKRNRHGLLVQGSLAKAGLAVDWGAFLEIFAQMLGPILNAEPEPWAEPFQASEGLCRHYASAQWNARR